nr:4Fe-4S binding protein [Butyrivibrio sp. XBB1001]
MFQEKACAKVAIFKVVSIWLFNLFLTMFGTMIFQTYLVFSGAGTLKKAIKLFWTFKVPWKWAYNGSIFPDWVAQFGFGFYSLMLTSTLIGLIVMVLYKERTWCTFCPMGTMTQGICKIKEKKGTEKK